MLRNEYWITSNGGYGPQKSNKCLGWLNRRRLAEQLRMMAQQYNNGVVVQW